MTKTTVCKQFTFDSAHRLLNHDGKCANEHGHTYKLEVFVTGPVNKEVSHPKQGMVIDFGDISHVWKESLEPLLDHQNLNKTIGPSIGVTTAENMAAWILSTFGDALTKYQLEILANGLDDEEALRATIPQISKVRLWETPTGYAEVEA